MKKKRILMYLVVLTLAFFGLVSCTSNPANPTTTTSQTDDLKTFVSNLKFNDTTIEYDGNAHNLTFEDKLPEGYEASVAPKTKYKDPGKYAYNLRVTYNGQTEVKRAYLTISKCKPNYTGATEFTVYLNDNSTQPQVSFDQEGVSLTTPLFFDEAGDYEVTLNTKETDKFLPIDPVKVTAHVEDSIYGLSFESKKVVLSDTVTEASLTFADTSSLPEGLSVVYENNVQNARGTYQVLGKVVDATNAVKETYKALLTVDNTPDAEFEEYANDVFINDFIEDDQIAINLFFVDYSAYGIQHGDSTWYAYSPFDSYTDEEYQHDLETIANARAEFDAFDTDKLSFSQLVTYDKINSYITNLEEMLSNRNNIIMRLSVVDQYGGQAADLPTQVEAYSFRTIEDIDDCLHMLESVYDSFDSYYTFILEREEHGYGLSEFTLKNFASYLDGVVTAFKNEAGYYLNDVIENKLTEAQKALNFSNEILNDYRAKFDTALNDNTDNATSVYKAHVDLSKKVTDYLTEKKANGYLADKDYTGYYLAEYEGGNDFYFSMLKNRLGLSDDVKPQAYRAEVDQLFNTYKNLWMEYTDKVNTNSKASAIVDNESYEYVEYDEVDDLIDFLKEFAKAIVPDLKSMPEIDITYMDPTVTANTTTVAYYMKSPLDSDNQEYIHLNGSALGKNNYETVSTLAHEGYPGHLYAYVYSKESDDISNLTRISTCTGHGEGWAKYVEYALGDYFIALHDGAEEWDIAMKYTQYYELFSYLLYARCDFGVNYEKWTKADLADFMRKLQLNSSDSFITDFYNTFNEAPSQYAPYGYGYATFVDLHNKAKAALGNWYNEVDFNEMLLSRGWIGLSSLKAYAQEYIENQMFLHDLA